MDTLLTLYEEITNDISQWVVSLPVWIQAPVVTSVALVLCGIGAVIALRLIDIVGSKIYNRRHREELCAVSTSSQRSVREGMSVGGATARSIRETRIVVHQEPIGREES